MRGLLSAFSAMLLMAAMFIAVHRGARGRMIAETISRVDDQAEAAEVQKNALKQRVEYLRGRLRIVAAARELGLHEPSEDELVYLDLRGLASKPLGGSS